MKTTKKQTKTYLIALLALLIGFGSGILFTSIRQSNSPDLNADGIVNSEDAEILSESCTESRMMACGLFNDMKDGDINTDGLIDQKDLDIVNRNRTDS